MQENARHIALCTVYGSWRRGVTVEQIRAGMGGRRGGGEAVQVGGYAFDPAETGTREDGYPLLRKLKADEIAVTEMGGVKCLFIFSVAALYAELTAEAAEWEGTKAEGSLDVVV